MANDLTYDVQINVNDATRNLDRLNTKVGNISKSFAGLKTALAGLALGSFISSTLKWADSIQDLSDATGIATQNILGFTQAVQQSGGTTEDAQKAITQLVQSLGEAKEGGAKVQYAFEQVGVSLKDLATLSEKDLLNKTVKGLAKIEDVTKRARIQNEIFGKSLRGVNIQSVASSIDTATTSAGKYASAIKTGADVQQKLDDQLLKLRLGLLAAIQPIVEMTDKLNLSVESISKFIRTAIKIAVVVLSFVAVFRAATLIFRGLSALPAILEANSIRFTAFGSALSKVGTRMAEFIQKYPKLVEAFQKSKYLAAAIAGYLGFNMAEDAVEPTTGGPVITRGGASEAMPKDYFANKRAEATSAAEVIDRNKQLRASILSVTEAYTKQNNDRLASLRMSLQEMTMSDNAVEKMQAHNDIYKQASDRVQELIDKKAALKPEEQAVAGVIDQQIVSILAQAQTQIDAADEIIASIQKVRAEQQQLQREYEITGQKARDNLQLDEMQSQIQTIGLYGDALTETNSLLAAEYELKAKLLDIELRRQQVMLNAAKLGPEAVAQELANLAAEETAARDYADRRVKIDKERLEKEQALRADGKAGVLQYFEELSRSVDPFVQAQQRATAVFGNMESALDTFVKTGKFKFKDFALSIIRDLIMIELRAKMVALFKTIGMAIFGLAGGGPATAGKPYIVGEKGPELFVPKSSGTVIPNGQLVGGGTGSSAGMGGPITNNYITNNISAIDAKGVAQMFAENRKTLLGTVRYAQKELSYAGTPV